MIGKIKYPVAAILFGLLLSSCQSLETPQQVAQHFWQAVIEDRPDKVIEYSTLVDIKDYDRFSMDWDGFQASQGKITIENNEASVEYTFTRPAATESKERKLTTYLLLQNEIWKVEYQKTREAMKPKKASGLLGRLNQLGKQLSEQLEDSTDDLNTELDKLGKKLQELSDQVGSEAAEGIEKFTEELEKSLEELEQSIDRALKEDRRQQPEQGDGKLQEI